MTSTVSNWFGLRGSETPAEPPKPAVVRTATAAPATPARTKAQGQPIAAAPKASVQAVPTAPRQETAAAEPQSRGTTAADHADEFVRKPLQRIPLALNRLVVMIGSSAGADDHCYA
jgi:hypothetical protein